MKNQSIGCNVDTCKYHCPDCTCRLDSIQVQTCGSKQCSAAAETQCASFSPRQG